MEHDEWLQQNIQTQTIDELIDKEKRERMATAKHTNAYKKYTLSQGKKKRSATPLHCDYNDSVYIVLLTLFEDTSRTI